MTSVLERTENSIVFGFKLNGDLKNPTISAKFFNKQGTGVNFKYGDCKADAKKCTILLLSPNSFYKFQVQVCDSPERDTICSDFSPFVEYFTMPGSKYIRFLIFILHPVVFSKLNLFFHV